jgi:KAP family P-loop domain
VEGDRLGRHGFAVRLSDSISQLATPDSVVIGLFGPWGSGKTTVLKFVENELASNDEVVVVWFNPWMVGGSEETLVHDFILTVAEAIDAKLDTRTERLVEKVASMGKLARVAGTIPFAGGAAATVASLSDAAAQSAGKSLGEFRIRLDERLEEKNKKVLVIIDDLDRLSRAQVATMFRVIKAIGEFRHTRYLLAFDRSVVARLLDGEFDGYAFIEKIVQVPLELPAPALSDLNNQFFALLNEALERHDISWSAELNNQLEGLIPFTGYHVRTPRSAKQLAYVVDFALPLVALETNPADLIMIEALRLFEPEAYHYVRTHREAFLFPQRNITDEGPRMPEFRLTSSGSGSIADRQFRVSELISWLFPALQTDVGKSIGHRAETNAGSGRHISQPEFFDNYFRYGPGEVSEADVEALISGLIAAEPGIWIRLEQLLKSDPDVLVTKLERRMDSANAATQKNLALALSKHANVFIAEDEELNDTLTSFGRIVAAIAKLVATEILPIDELTNTGEIHLVAKILRSIDAKWNADRAASGPRWNKLGERLAVDERAPLFVGERTFGAPLMTALVSFSPEVRNTITLSVWEDESLALGVLQSWCSRVPCPGGTPRWGEHQFHDYDGLSKIIEPPTLATALDGGAHPDDRPTFVNQFLAEHAVRTAPPMGPVTSA